MATNLWPAVLIAVVVATTLLSTAIFHQYDSVLSFSYLNSSFGSIDKIEDQIEDQSNISSGGRYLLTRSPPFQIKSKTQLDTPYSTNGKKIDLCVQMEEAGVDGSDLIVQKCVEDRISQQWSADQFGRFHSMTDVGLCMSAIDGMVKKCNFNRRNPLSIDAFSGTINTRKNGFKTLSYNPDAEEVRGSRVFSTKFGSANEWDIVPSTVFQSQEDLTLDEILIKLKADPSKCVAASSLDRKSPLVIEACDPSNNKHLWKYDEGKIHIANREKKCIVKGSPWSNGDPELYIGTPCRRLSKNKVFIYDAVTSKIVHQRNNFKAFTVEGNDVVLSYNHPQNNAVQEFLLEAP